MTRWRDYRRGLGHAHTVVGPLKVLDALYSPQLHNERQLLVLLPSSYTQGDQRYPVLYMHDGQNLFDQTTSFAGEWQVDETMQALDREGVEAIVVGIPNMGHQRVPEYTPFRERHRRSGLGQAYTAFLVETVKTRVDHDFRTLADRNHTGVLGSSLGGLISLYAFFRYPEVFGLIGALSPAIFLRVPETFAFIRDAPFAPGRIYMDVGSREAYSGKRETRRMQGDSERYLETVRAMRDLLVEKGYCPGAELMYVEDVGARHHESAWARRLPDALRFLLREAQ
jgi:predicted alpha/beta superfamily hydrolase